MYLGASLGYLGVVATPADDLNYVREAERLGCRSIWVPEPYGHDCASVLGAVAVQTSRILIGSAIMAIPGRTAAMCAQTAATLDWLSGSRMLLGLGTSGPQVSEGWHGVPFAKPILRTREYVEVVRMAIAREKPVVYQGKTIQLPLPGGEGKPLKLILSPPRAAIPIYLAALGPKNLELCGEIADGWLPIWFAPEHAASLRQPLDAGARKANRDPAAIDIVVQVTVSIDDDVGKALDALRPTLALYVGGMGSREHNFYNDLACSYGFAEAAGKIQDLYLAGRKAEAAALVPAELIDRVCLCGPVERVAARIPAYRDAGVGTLSAIPVAAKGEARLEQLRKFVQAGQQSGCVELVTG
jgi:F420-dependent oxidoreductase-like protein